MAVGKLHADLHQQGLLMTGAALFVGTPLTSLRVCCPLLFPLAQPVFELLCNLSLIPEWDVLFKSGRYLSFAADPAGRCEVAYLHIVYGLPGEAHAWVGGLVGMRTARRTVSTPCRLSRGCVASIPTIAVASNHPNQLCCAVLLQACPTL